MLTALTLVPQMAASLPSTLGNQVWIRSLNPEPVQAMVSKFTSSGGSIDWFTLPSNYDDPVQSLWTRTPGGWELAAFRNQTNQNERVGFYHDFSPNATFVTFYSFDYVTFSTENPEA